MSDLRTLTAFKAKYEALRMEAPTEEIRDYMDATIHDAINPAISVATREHNDALWESTRHLSEGMGGNDPGNARAAAMEAAE